MGCQGGDGSEFAGQLRSGASAETVVVAPTLSTKTMKTLPVATEEATETLRGSHLSCEESELNSVTILWQA